MKVRTLSLFTITILFAIISNKPVHAQQYKLKQVSSMSGMKSEMTIYVKGPRKRTEGAGFMGMGANIVNIEQCDLQRTIKINDKKKLYYIEPFAKEIEEVTEDVKPAAKAKPVPASTKATKQGGTIYMYYNITDTGERKKMYGFNARHVWTTQKMKPSADACMMKDSMIIKTDGWYIDLPQFNCPVTGGGRGGYGGGTQKPDCMDRFVSKRSGKGKLGFPLIEKRTMIMGGQATTNEFETNLETLELSTVKLDSMLFEIPLGYTETKNEQDLQEKFDASQMMNQGGYGKDVSTKVVSADRKAAGITRIGVYQPTGEESVQPSSLQSHVVNSLIAGKVEAIAINSLEDAKIKHCDYLLAIDITKLKQGSKAGSILKAIRNADPSASTSYQVEGNMKLTKISDGSTRTEQKITGKYDGKPEEAAKKAMEKACTEILNELD